MSLTKIVVLIVFTNFMLFVTYFFGFNGDIEPTTVGLIGGIVIMFGIEQIGEKL